MKRSIFLVCLGMLLLALVCASAEELDLSRTGSIALELTGENGQVVSGGSFRLYRVGAPAIRENNLVFDRTADFAESGVSLEDLSKSALAEQLAAYVETARPAPLATASADAKGKVQFSGLECGLYLVMQQPQKGDTYEPMTAFLASIPMTDPEGTRWLYDVSAKPKVEIKPAPSVTPGPTPGPEEPRLPQTGMLLWPIPVLAGLGIGLFVLGWVLVFRRKRHD